MQTRRLFVEAVEDLTGKVENIYFEKNEKAEILKESIYKIHLVNDGKLYPVICEPHASGTNYMFKSMDRDHAPEQGLITRMRWIHAANNKPIEHLIVNPFQKSFSQLLYKKYWQN